MITFFSLMYRLDIEMLQASTNSWDKYKEIIRHFLTNFGKVAQLSWVRKHLEDEPIYLFPAVIVLSLVLHHEWVFSP